MSDKLISRSVSLSLSLSLESMTGGPCELLADRLAVLDVMSIECFDLKILSLTLYALSVLIFFPRSLRKFHAKLNRLKCSEITPCILF